MPFSCLIGELFTRQSRASKQFEEKPAQENVNIKRSYALKNMAFLSTQLFNTHFKKIVGVGVDVGFEW